MATEYHVISAGGLQLAVSTGTADDPYDIETFDTTYSLPTGGTTWYAYLSGEAAPYGNGDGSVNDNGDGTNTASLQNCLNNCALGDVIYLKAGSTYSGYFNVPAKGAGTDWIYIISSGIASLPAAGTRVAASDATNMSKIQSTGGSPTVTSNYGVHHVRFVGIEFTSSYAGYPYSYVWLGYEGGAWPDTDSEFAHHITFDRCYLHGDLQYSAVRAIDGAGKYIAIIDSHIAEIHTPGGSQCQCFNALFGAGPYKIVNNYLEASSQNIMFGGASGGGDLWEPNPANIEIRYNHMKKKLIWDSSDPGYDGYNFNVITIVELKMGESVLIEGNVMENSWQHVQKGPALTITPRENEIKYVTFRNNLIINTDSAAQITSSNFLISDVLVENNLFTNSDIWGFDIGHGEYTTQRLTIQHNTIIGMSNTTIVMGETPYCCNDVEFKDNILTGGQYEIFGTGRTMGVDSIQYYMSNYEFDSNVIIGGTANKYTGDANAINWYFPANNAAVGFVDTTFDDLTDFALDSGSDYYQAGSDGDDIGADISAIIAACNASDLPF